MDNRRWPSRPAPSMRPNRRPTYVHRGSFVLGSCPPEPRGVQATYSGTVRGAAWPHWNLLRPVLEASFWTVWILEPEDGRERRRRGLRAEIDDAREQEKWLNEIRPIVGEEGVAQALANISESNQTFRREAEQLGMTWGRAREPVLVTRELGRLQAFKDWEEDMGPFFAGVWRRLSGAQHGKIWSLLLGSEKSLIAEIPGGSVVHVTTRDEDFITQVKTVGLLYLTALQLWINRNTKQ